MQELSPRPGDRIGADGAGYAVGGLLLLGLAGLHLWLAPHRDAMAVAALAVALALDAGARLALAAAQRQVGLTLALAGQPSVILTLAGTPLAPAAALAGLLVLLGPERFPPCASLIAGLMAMGGLARLALARTVTLAAREGPEPPGA